MPQPPSTVSGFAIQSICDVADELSLCESSVFSCQKSGPRNTAIRISLGLCVVISLRHEITSTMEFVGLLSDVQVRDCKLSHF